MKKRYKRKSLLEPEPNDYIESDGFRIINFGDQHFFPHPSLRNGLKEVIIFTENNKKFDIPNGSVWIYEGNTPYNPNILMSDVGCGITGFLTEKIDFSIIKPLDFAKAVNEINLKIGRGNHFLSITESTPDINEKSNMIFLHTDFNPLNFLPSTIKDAENLISESEEKRKEFIYSLLYLLQVNGAFYNNWTHNSVKRLDGNIYYGKGAINIYDSENEGILALNPFDGILVYIAEWDEYYGYMQHGTGKAELRSYDRSQEHFIKYKGIKVLINDREKPEGLYNEYNSIDKFKNKFVVQLLPVEFLKPEIVLFTY